MLKQIKRGHRDIQQTTVRDFGGGLNVVDNDLNLDSRYATVLSNMYRGQDGTQAVRYGTKFFASLADLGFNGIVGIRYFNGTIVCVNEDGRVASVLGDGTATIIMDDSIAATLPGAPDAWLATNYVSFAEFNGVLVLCNGVNKPLVVYSDNTSEYLVDGATGSNFYVPVARNVSVHNQYVVLSGDPNNPTILYIGNIGTLGVFEGAPDPNDGVNLDMGPYVRIGSPFIRGHTSFRDKLIVFFDDMVLPGTLGIYDDTDNHTPSFTDAIEQIGAINTNTAIPIGDDVFFCGSNSISSLTRALFTGEVRPETPSALIDPLVAMSLARLSDSALEDNVFAVYNEQENQYMLFVPNGNTRETTSETYCFVYTLTRQSKDRQWALFRGWNWSSATHTAGGRVFFAHGSELFYYGTTIDEFFGDYIEFEDTWSDGTIFDDGHGWEVPADLDDYDQSVTGVPIRFDWFFPWADFDKRMYNKFSLYAGLDTTGSAQYTLDMFVDNIVVDNSTLGESFTDDTFFTDGTGWIPQSDIPYLPALSMDFTAAGESGYGAGPFGVMPYGGGRPTPYEQLYAWNAKFNIAKFRVHGESREKLRVVSLTILYNIGSIRR